MEAASSTAPPPALILEGSAAGQIDEQSEHAASPSAHPPALTIRGYVASQTEEQSKEAAPPLEDAPARKAQHKVQALVIQFQGGTTDQILAALEDYKKYKAGQHISNSFHNFYIKASNPTFGSHQTSPKYKHRADTLFTTEWVRQPLLHLAIARLTQTPPSPCDNLVDALLKAQVPAASQDKLGRTGIHLAAFLGRTDVIETLIAYGVNLFAVDCCGYTALDYAILSRSTDQFEVFRYLILKMEPEIAGYFRDTVRLDQLCRAAVRFGSDPFIIAELLRMGARFPKGLRIMLAANTPEKRRTLFFCGLTEQDIGEATDPTNLAILQLATTISAEEAKETPKLKMVRHADPERAHAGFNLFCLFKHSQSLWNVLLTGDYNRVLSKCQNRLGSTLNEVLLPSEALKFDPLKAYIACSQNLRRLFPHYQLLPTAIEWYRTFGRKPRQDLYETLMTNWLAQASPNDFFRLYGPFIGSIVYERLHGVHCFKERILHLPKLAQLFDYISSIKSGLSGAIETKVLIRNLPFDAVLTWLKGLTPKPDDSSAGAAAGSGAASGCGEAAGTRISTAYGEEVNKRLAELNTPLEKLLLVLDELNQPAVAVPNPFSADAKPSQRIKYFQNQLSCAFHRDVTIYATVAPVTFGWEEPADRVARSAFPLSKTARP